MSTHPIAQTSRSLNSVLFVCAISIGLGFAAWSFVADLPAPIIALAGLGGAVLALWAFIGIRSLFFIRITEDVLKTWLHRYQYTTEDSEMVTSQFRFVARDHLGRTVIVSQPKDNLKTIEVRGRLRLHETQKAAVSNMAESERLVLTGDMQLEVIRQGVYFIAFIETLGIVETRIILPTDSLREIDFMRSVFTVRAANEALKVLLDRAVRSDISASDD